mgnify:CR=1 FL=1
MKLEKAISTFELAISKHLNLKPEQIRCEKEGEYIVNRDKTALYIDLWQPEEVSQWQYFGRENIAGVFQIIAPVCFYPADEHLPMFLEELAHLNFHLFFGAFIANNQERIVSIQYKRVLTGLNETEIIEPLEAVGYYAENLSEYLKEKYHVKKVD